MKIVLTFIWSLFFAQIMAQAPEITDKFFDHHFQVVKGNKDISISKSCNTLFPNRTWTDIGGVSHTIYDALDNGKIVVLGFMEYTGTTSEKEVKYLNHLKNIYQDQEEMIELISIEKTLHSNIGININNWYTDNELDYPLINLNGIATDPFLVDVVTGIPTFIIISPDRTFTSVSTFSSVHHILSKVNQHILEAAGLSADYDLDLFSIEHDFCGDSKNIYATVQNTGLLTTESLTLKLYTDSNILVDSLHYNITLEANARAEFSLFYPSNSLSYTNLKLEIETNYSNENLKNNGTNIFLAENEVFTGTQITIKIQTDNYGEETAWQLYNATTNMIVDAEGFTGNTISGLTNGLHEYPQSLIENNCYTLQVFDEVGDGMCCSYGNGSIKIVDNSTGLLITDGGEFELSEKLHFRVNSASIGIEEEKFQATTTKEIKQIQYFDVLGRTFERPIKNTILIKKTTFLDNSVESEKIHLK